MRRIFELLIRYRVVVSFLLTSVASLMMIGAPPAFQARTGHLLTISVFFPLQISIDQVKRAQNIYAENRRLKNDLALLNATVAQLKDQAGENDRLRSMLGFERNSTYDLIPVRVVARDPSTISKSIVVNAGRSKGVVQYMPVVGEQGVVGKVVQVMPDLSLVQLINDPFNRTSIMIRRSRAVSILETENGTSYSARFRTHEEVAAGDTVVTSGLGGIYPRGFMLGRVEKMVDEHDPLFKKAVLKPTINLDRLEELFIVRMPPQWASYREQLDSLQIKRKP
jgi:rod shape-determining protein MreC